MPNESEDLALEASEEDLLAFNSLVQDGLIEVVMIEDGMPYYRISSEFAGATGPGVNLRPPRASFVLRRVDRVSDAGDGTDIHVSRPGIRRRRATWTSTVQSIASLSLGPA
jgi:hypothetical protein